MYLSGSQKILKSMNGLLKISATDIDATNASITNLNDIQNITGAIGSDLVIDVDTGKKIQLKDNVQMDTNLNVIGNIHAGGKLDISGNSTFDGVCNFNNPVFTNSTFKARSIDASNTSVFRSNINVLGTGTIFRTMQVDEDININGRLSSFGSTNTMDGSLNIKGVLDVSRNSIFRNNLDVSANLYVGKNSTAQTSSVDVNGTIYLRDPSQPSVVYMKIYYEPTLYGFVFQSETQGRNMNFRVKDNAGNYKLFYFGAGQLYSAIFTYIDTGLNVSYNNQFTLGDSNGTAWAGVSQKYIPNTAVASGHVTYNKGLMNNATYYSNWVHVNTSNVDVPTMRMSWQGIWSKVPHTMESTLSVTGNLTLTGNLIANSTTITPVQLSYLNGTASNIQTQLNNKLDLTGGTISGNLTISGTTTLNSQVNLNDILYVNSTTITPTQLSYLSGVSSNIQNQLNNKVNSADLGYTKSGNTLTFAANTILNVTSGTGEIRCDKLNCYNIIEFPDLTIQNTGYTNARNDKLTAIGTITTATLGANFTLTTGVFYSPGSISLVAGTYIITVNACVAVISGSTIVGQMLAGYSTSSTGLSQNINLAILNGGATYNIGNQWALNSSNIITVASTTLYYLQIQCNFGTASRMQYVQGNSDFKAVRIA